MTQGCNSLHGNLRVKRICEHKPVFIGVIVQAAKYLSPGKLSLTGKIRIDNSLMEHTPLGVIWCVGLVKEVVMRKQDYLNAPILVGNRFDLENTAVGTANAQDVL